MKTISALTLHGEQKKLPAEKFEMRVAAYCFIVHENTVLLVNTKSTGKWWVPGGKVEAGEQVQEAMKREVFEETGIEIEVNRFVTYREVFFYYDPLDEAYQNIALYFVASPKSLEVTNDYNVADDESNKPTWVEIDSLTADDFQKGLYDVFTEAIFN